MNDRFTNGFIAGISAGIFAVIVNIILIDLLNFGELRYIDFSGMFLFGKLPGNFIEHLVALVGYLIFTGILGVIFNFLIPFVTSKYYLIKGIVYGVGVWFFTYAIVVLFKVPIAQKNTLESSVSNFFSAISFGLALAIVLFRLQRKKELV